MIAGSQTMVRAPNSVVLVGDPAGEPPESMDGNLVSVASSCVAVGTMSEADGETTIRIVDAAPPPDRSGQLAFEGKLEIPSSRLTVASVLGETYLERPVDGPVVPLQIWVNDTAEPDEVCVVIG